MHGECILFPYTITSLRINWTQSPRLVVNYFVISIFTSVGMRGSFVFFILLIFFCISFFLLGRPLNGGHCPPLSLSLSPPNMVSKQQIPRIPSSLWSHLSNFPSEQAAIILASATAICCRSSVDCSPTVWLLRFAPVCCCLDLTLVSAGRTLFRVLLGKNKGENLPFLHSKPVLVHHGQN